MEHHSERFKIDLWMNMKQVYKTSVNVLPEFGKLILLMIENEKEEP